jgi:hypothetical protein
MKIFILSGGEFLSDAHLTFEREKNKKGEFKSEHLI